MGTQGWGAATDCSFHKSHHCEVRGGELTLSQTQGTGKGGRGCECWNAQGSPQDTGMGLELVLTEAWTGLAMELKSSSLLLLSSSWSTERNVTRSLTYN